MSDQDPNHFGESVVEDNPKKVADLRICNQTIELLTADKIYEDKTKTAVFGSFCHYPKPKIYVNLEVLQACSFQFRTTIFHEILEGISAINNLNLTESQIRVLEQSLMGFCADNRDEAGYILFNLASTPKEKLIKAKSKVVLKNKGKI
jgi:hypothetical protein